jgi:1,4-dihydroxy-2-naphthoate octaprenyltransferase
MEKKKIACWIEAMRLRTLPVSVAGVITAVALSVLAGRHNGAVTALCLTFAVLAQIASNFANEYFDYRDGLDKPGREGPRRGVTEGDITPRAMLAATLLTLAAACLIGLGLVAYGGWWLVPAGAAIALGALAYSAGPYPLSRHGLGEVAVIAFFGVVPVCLTYYVETLSCEATVAAASLSIGLMGANVLMINNYRDRDDDKAVGKRTLTVIIGRQWTAALYLINGYMAVALMTPLWAALPAWSWSVPTAYLLIHTALWLKTHSLSGRRLNPLLGLTAIAMFIYAAGLLAVAITVGPTLPWQC